MTFEYILNERARDEFEKGLIEGEAIGLKKGRSEGEAIGAAQEKREIAEKLKELGVGAAEIIKATGLSTEEVEEL